MMVVTKRNGGGEMRDDAFFLLQYDSKTDTHVQKQYTQRERDRQRERKKCKKKNG